MAKKGMIIMPTLSIFFGIIIRMLAEQGVNHNTPHIHEKYNDYEVSVAFDGTVLGGIKKS